MIGPELSRRAWFRGFPARPARQVRLVCFPHACGSATAYRPWDGLLPPDVELVAVQYPGHGDRFGEPCATSVHEIADEVADGLRGAAWPPLVLFGHSLGAAIAYEVARRLGPDDVDLRGLIVSGRPAPHVAGAPPVFDTDEELWAELARLGGTDAQLAGNAAARKVFTPLLRADYRLNATYRPASGGMLSCAITGYRGRDDDTVSRDQLARWADLTTGPFRFEEFGGGHFYLASARREFVRTLGGCVQSLVARRTA